MIDLKELPTDLDEEAIKARELAETMKILYAASCGARAADLKFGDITNSLFLFWQMLETHTDRLNELSKTAYSIK